MKKLFLLAILFATVSCQKEVQEINPDDILVIEDSKPSAAIQAKGFYVVNEDWFGHDFGSLNYFKADGTISYRAYRAANSGETLGTTSQFGTIFAKRLFVVSKQAKRLVIANAATLKKEAVIEDIGGDGRAFLGINESKAYVGTSKGVSILDLKTNTIAGSISGIAAATGNMVLSNGRAFIVTNNQGVYIVDVMTDKVEKQIEGSFSSMTISKSGAVWIGAADKLISIDPVKMEIVSELSVPRFASSWGAWNAGSLCSSTTENVIYWITGDKTIVRYDIDTKTLNTSFYTLGKDDQGKQLAFYGSGMRVDPITNKLILTIVRSGWGDSFSYNWIYVLSSTGAVEKSLAVNGDEGKGEEWGTAGGRYFWFPAVPFFEDCNQPELILNQVIIKPSENITVDLSSKLYDADNLVPSMLLSVDAKSLPTTVAKCELKGFSLTITAGAEVGKGTITVNVTSNGVTTSKIVRVDVRKVQN